jgi:hypothetical protein
MTFYQFIRPNPLQGPTEEVLTGISVTLFPAGRGSGKVAVIEELDKDRSTLLMDWWECIGRQ